MSLPSLDDIQKARGLLGRVLDDIWCGTFGDNPDRELMSDLEEVLRYIGGHWQPTPCPMTIPDFIEKERLMFDAKKVDLFGKTIEAKVKEIFEGLQTNKNEQAQSLYDLSIDSACKDVKHGLMHFRMALQKTLDQDQLNHVFGADHTDAHIEAKACDDLVAKLKPSE